MGLIDSWSPDPIGVLGIPLEIARASSFSSSRRILRQSRDLFRVSLNITDFVVILFPPPPLLIDLRGILWVSLSINDCRSGEFASSKVLDLFDPFLDLFNFWNFSRYLHHSVNNQSRSYKHPIIGDGFNVFHLGDLGFNTQLLDCFFSSLLELIAFGSTHSENFDLLHHSLYLLLI